MLKSKFQPKSQALQLAEEPPIEANNDPQALRGANANTPMTRFRRRWKIK
jgi:hypothetical protein